MNLVPIAEVPTSEDEESRLASYESNRVAKVDHIRYALSSKGLGCHCQPLVSTYLTKVVSKRVLQ